MKTIIEMAREAGLRDCTCNGTKGCLERLVELVRADAIADEREACAVLVEGLDHCSQYFPHVPDIIRARGETSLRSNT